MCGAVCGGHPLPVSECSVQCRRNTWLGDSERGRPPSPGRVSIWSHVEPRVKLRRFVGRVWLRCCVVAFDAASGGLMASLKDSALDGSSCFRGATDVCWSKVTAVYNSRWYG